jgi:hypothetical protein
LKSKAALANARLAYELFEKEFAASEWKDLQKAGANKQRPLMASTGVKDTSLPDTLYVAELIAPELVNTMPEATMEAVFDHGVISPDTITGMYANSRAVLAELAELQRALEELGVGHQPDLHEHTLQRQQVPLLGGAVAMLGLWWSTTIPALGNWIQARMSGLGARMRQSGEIFNQMVARPGPVLAGVGLSVVSLAAHFLGYAFSARAFETGLGAGTIFAVMPVVDTLTMIPIALYGLGLREALFAVLLGEFHNVPSGTATLVSLGGFAAQAVVALSGILFLPFVKLLRFGNAGR